MKQNKKPKIKTLTKNTKIKYRFFFCNQRITCKPFKNQINNLKQNNNKTNKQNKQTNNNESK
jgi:hypothetical protein